MILLVKPTHGGTILKGTAEDVAAGGHAQGSYETRNIRCPFRAKYLERPRSGTIIAVAPQHGAEFGFCD